MLAVSAIPTSQSRIATAADQCLELHSALTPSIMILMCRDFDETGISGSNLSSKATQEVDLGMISQSKTRKDPRHAP